MASKIKRDRLSGLLAANLSSSSPRVFSSDGTWTKPANLSYIIVEVVGAGGGGGGVTGATSQAACANGGGGGGYSKKKILAASLASTETVVVGVGGAGGTAGNNSGSNGESSSFGSGPHLQAGGGLGGVGQAASATAPRVGGATGGVPGSGSGGDINLDGDPAFPGLIISTTEIFSSRGGGGVMAGASRNSAGTGADTDGVVGRSYGGGGTGAYSTNNATSRAGGTGADGVVIVWEFVEV